MPISPELKPGLSSLPVTMFICFAVLSLPEEGVMLLVILPSLFNVCEYLANRRVLLT